METIHRMRRGVWGLVFVCVLAFQGAMFAVHVEAKSVAWSEVQTAVYSPLHPYILNWTGDVLESGGLNLTTMSIIENPWEADIVMNQYGDMGAAGILEGGEDLTTPTDSDLAGYTNSVRLEQNKVYLVSR